MSEPSAQELHDWADAAACRGDYKTADAWRLLEGNARGGEVIRRWVYSHLAATEAEIRRAAEHYAVGWRASADALYEQAMSVVRDATTQR